MYWFIGAAVCMSSVVFIGSLILCGFLTYKLYERDTEISERDFTIESLQNEFRFLSQEHLLQLQKKENEIDERIEAARKETIKQSRATLRGQATEHLAPLVMSDFNPKDFRFMANPVDYLVVRGLSDVLDGVGGQVSVYLLEIKTGSSQLTKSQRAIREAIIKGRTTFAVFNPDTGELKEWKTRDSAPE